MNQKMRGVTSSVAFVPTLPANQRRMHAAMPGGADCTHVEPGKLFSRYQPLFRFASRLRYPIDPKAIVALKAF